MKPGNALGANPKTTFAGIVSLLFAALQIYSNPKLLADPTMGPMIVGQVAAGLGMVFARDSKAQDPVRTPTVGVEPDPPGTPPKPPPLS